MKIKVALFRSFTEEEILNMTEEKRKKLSRQGWMFGAITFILFVLGVLLAPFLGVKSLWLSTFAVFNSLAFFQTLADFDELKYYEIQAFKQQGLAHSQYAAVISTKRKLCGIDATLMSQKHAK